MILNNFDTQYFKGLQPSPQELAVFYANCTPHLIYPTQEFLNFLQDFLEGDMHCLYIYDREKPCECVEKNMELVGILPYFRIEKEFDGKSWTVINSLPWYGSHGGCYVHNAADQKQVRYALLQQFKILLDQEPHLLSCAICLSSFEEQYSAIYQDVLQADTVESRIGQIMTLPKITQDENISVSLMRLMRRRSSLKKGIRQNFTYITQDTDLAWDYVYQTQLENMQAINVLHKERSHFEKLRKNLGKYARIHLALYEGKPVAALLALYYKPSVEYFVPVITHEYRSSEPLSYIIHTAMIDAVKEGYKYWNFGGTGIFLHSLHHFKATWGAVDCPYSYIIKTTEEGRKLLAKDINVCMAQFPFYYLYPKAFLGQ